VTDSDNEDEAFRTEAEAVEYAIERLVEAPYEVAGACLRGLSPTAIDIIARAEDDALEQVAGVFGSMDALRALRFVCSLALTLGQARRHADIIAPAEDAGAAP
jgi:hypothetical protein